MGIYCTPLDLARELEGWMENGNPFENCSSRLICRHSQTRGCFNKTIVSFGSIHFACGGRAHSCATTNGGIWFYIVGHIDKKDASIFWGKLEKIKIKAFVFRSKNIKLYFTNNSLFFCETVERSSVLKIFRHRLPWQVAASSVLQILNASFYSHLSTIFVTTCYLKKRSLYNFFTRAPNKLFSVAISAIKATVVAFCSYHSVFGFFPFKEPGQIARRPRYCYLHNECELNNNGRRFLIFRNQTVVSAFSSFFEKLRNAILYKRII